MVDITVQQIQSTPALAQQWQRTAGGRTNMPSDTPSWIAALKAAGIQVPPGTVPVATPDGISFTPSSQNFFGPGYGGSMSAPRAPTTFASNATPNSALPPYANPEGAPPSANMSGSGSSGMPDWLKTVIKTGIGVSPAIIGLIANHRASGGSNGSGTGVAGGTGLPPALAGQFGQLLDLQLNRARANEPVHAAALALAQRMGAGTASSPAALAQGIEQSRTSRPSTQMDPAVLAAIQHLTGGIR